MFTRICNASVESSAELGDNVADAGARFWPLMQLNQKTHAGYRIATAPLRLRFSRVRVGRDVGLVLSAAALTAAGAGLGTGVAVLVGSVLSTAIIALWSAG